jgi:hypothetical protein
MKEKDEDIAHPSMVSNPKKHRILAQCRNSPRTTPTGDNVAWFKDPDGNIPSVGQHHS